MSADEAGMISLRSFHLFFIYLALSLMVFTLAWAGRQAMAGRLDMGLLAAAGALLFLGLGYLSWFKRRYKGLR